MNKKEISFLLVKQVRIMEEINKLEEEIKEGAFSTPINYMIG